jgi:hypothetical protein
VPVRDPAGVYGWYFGPTLPGVPVGAAHRVDDFALRYGPFRAELSALRSACRRRARELPAGAYLE